MPIDSYIDETRRCVVTKIYGDFTLDEIIDTINRSVRDPKFRPGFGVLSDHTRVGEPLTTPQAAGMVNHLESLTEFFAGARWAAVTSKPASYGMLRMVSVLTERVPMEVQIFPTHEEAEAWLCSRPAK